MVSQVQQRTYTRVTRFVLARLSLLPKKLVDFLLWRRRYRHGHGHGPGVIVVNVVVGIVGVVGAVGVVVVVVVVALQACQLRIHHTVLMCGTGRYNERLTPSLARDGRRRARKCSAGSQRRLREK